MLQSIFIPFLTILVAELFDKSQLAILLLASKTKHHVALFLGTFVAFLLVDGFAILAGSWITTVVPQSYITIAASIAFLVFGILALRAGKEKEEHKAAKIGHPFVTGFSLIFLAEWGDKTQLASALFATRFPLVAVFVGVIAALSILTVATIYLGKMLSHRVDRTYLNYTTGIIFLLLGLYFLFFS